MFLIYDKETKEFNGIIIYNKDIYELDSDKFGSIKIKLNKLEFLKLAIKNIFRR